MDARFLSLAGSMFAEVAAGSAYGVSVYAPQLKAALNFTQTEINSMTSAANVGMYLAMAAGMTFDAAGALTCVIIGSVLLATGYLLMWAGTLGHVPATGTSMAVYAFLWGHGGSWIDTVAVTINVRNFPATRGSVVGILKSFFGLSASIIALFYRAVFQPALPPYLLFLGTMLPLVGLLGGSVAKLQTPGQAVVPLTAPQETKLRVGFVSVLALAGTLAATSLVLSETSVADSTLLPLVLTPFAAFAVALAFRWPRACACTCLRRGGSKHNPASAPLLVAGDAGTTALVAAGGGHARRRSSGAVDTDAGDSESESRGTGATAMAAASSYLRAAMAAAAERPVTGATLVEGLLCLDFWLILVALAAGAGSGIVLINNLGNLCLSLGGTPNQQNVLVVLLSVCNCLGRISFGFISDATARWVSRPTWLAVVVGGTGAAMVLLTFSNLRMLYAAAMVTGFFYGGYWSVTPSLVNERFGSRSFATLSSSATIGVAVSSYLLSAVMASDIYDSHTPATSNTCTGAACFQVTFAILAGVCTLGTATLAWLAYKLRPLYVGEGGTAIEYAAFIASYGHHGCLRATKRSLLALCCRRGWSLVADTSEWPPDAAAAYEALVVSFPGAGGSLNGGDAGGGGGSSSVLAREASRGVGDTNGVSRILLGEATVAVQVPPTSGSGSRRPGSRMSGTTDDSRRTPDVMGVALRDMAGSAGAGGQSMPPEPFLPVAAAPGSSLLAPAPLRRAPGSLAGPDSSLAAPRYTSSALHDDPFYDTGT